MSTFSAPAPLRIVLFGPESTGKSTLAAQLASHFGEPCSEEYVRAYWDAHGGIITASDLDAIARGQQAGEDAAAASARRLVFHDTDLLTCTLWDDLLFPAQCPPWVREEALFRARRTSLFLLCLTDLPFAADPQRCFPDEAGRRLCMNLWRDTLEGPGLPFVEISGEAEERFERAAAAVRTRLLNSGP